MAYLPCPALPCDGLHYSHPQSEGQELGEIISKLSWARLLKVDIKTLSAPVKEIIIECQDFKGDGTLAKTEAWMLMSECVDENPLHLDLKL